MRRVRSEFLQSVSRWSLAVLGAGLTLVAPHAASAQECPNAAIRAQQGPAVEAMPDCMALEMVSAPRKYSQNAGVPMLSVDGDRALYNTRGAVEGAPSQENLLFGDTYVATRGPEGWTSQPTSLSDPDLRQPGEQTARSFSPDLTRWLAFGATLGERQEGIARLFASGVDGSLVEASPLLTPLDRRHGRIDYLLMSQASADHSRVFIQTGESATYGYGDPSPSGADAQQNWYVSTRSPSADPTLSLVARDAAGQVWGGRCGVSVGGGLSKTQGAVSHPDGSRLFFSTRPGQTGTGACDSAANKLRILERDETSSGATIGSLIASECDRVAPACNTTDGDDFYEGASADGTKVYFTTTRQLVDSDMDAGIAGVSCSSAFFVAAGCDLYLHDSTKPVGSRLTLVSAGDGTNPPTGTNAGVFSVLAGISGDGSHVYFVAQGKLTNVPNALGQTAVDGDRNLYAYVVDDEHPAGELSFVAKVAVEDESKLYGGFGTIRYGTWNNAGYPVPVTETDAEGNEVGGDGHVFVFQTEAGVDPTDTDGVTDVYRYDADTGELERISVGAPDAPGGAGNGAFPVGPRAGGNPKPEYISTDFAERKRWVSEDGGTVVFKTAEGLASGDDNGVVDVYLWREGVVHRVAGSADLAAIAALGGLDEATRRPTLSHDGSVVAFATSSRVLPEDGDTVSDIYVARVDGGYLRTTEQNCTALTDTCQGRGATPAGVALDTLAPAGAFAPLLERAAFSVRTLSRAQRARLAKGRSGALHVRVNRPGRLRVRGTAKIGRRVRRVAIASGEAFRAGTVRLELRLDGAARRALAKRGRLEVAFAVRFGPARGTRRLTVQLRSPKRADSSRPSSRVSNNQKGHR
ncbi:MAG TPA: hypothetical protein VEW67_08410 [Thermoleophilaceae bacterium]|nr:hypothetical protein [Thermoleophilaceae bacterium]